MTEKKKKGEHGFYDIDETSDYPVHERYAKEGKRKEAGKNTGTEKEKRTGNHLEGLDIGEEE